MWIFLGDDKEFFNTNHISHISKVGGDPAFRRYTIYFAGGDELVLFEKEYSREKLIKQILDQQWWQKKNNSSLA